MTDLPPSPSPSRSEPGSGSLARLRRLAALADGTLASVRWLGILSLAAGTWLWIWSLGSVARQSVAGAALALPVLLVLLLPTGVVWLLYWALRQIRSLPDRVRETASGGRDKAGALWQAATARGDERVRRPWNLLRAVHDIWSLVMESKELILAYAAIARLANPVSLVVIVGGVIGAMLLCAAGLVSIVVVALF